MFRLIQFEIYKILKRKESWILYLMCLIPLFYAIGFGVGADNIEYKGELNSLSALDFADDMFLFGYYILVFTLSIGFIMVSGFRSEIDSGSITLLVNKVCSRKKIYFVKIMSVTIFITIFTIVFTLFSILTYMLFLKSSIIANGMILGENAVSDIIRIFCVLLMYIWSVILVGLLSTKFKSFMTMGIFTVIWAVFMYLKELNATKFLSPIYYLINVIENTNITNFIIFDIILIASGMIMYMLSLTLFEKSDLD